MAPSAAKPAATAPTANPREVNHVTKVLATALATVAAPRRVVTYKAAIARYDAQLKLEREKEAKAQAKLREQADKARKADAERARKAGAAMKSMHAAAKPVKKPAPKKPAPKKHAREVAEGDAPQVAA